MGFETTLDHVLVWLCDDRWAGKSLLVCCSTQSVTVQLQNCVTKWFFDKWSSCWIELNAAGAAGSGFTCGWSPTFCWGVQLTITFEEEVGSSIIQESLFW